MKILKSDGVDCVALGELWDLYGKWLQTNELGFMAWLQSQVESQCGVTVNPGDRVRGIATGNECIVLDEYPDFGGQAKLVRMVDGTICDVPFGTFVRINSDGTTSPVIGYKR